MSIATKTGDDGTTALMFGRRVPKTNPQVEAYGTVDELNAALGNVRAQCRESFITDEIFAIQKELVILMGELSVESQDRARYAEKGFKFVTSEMVDRLTALIDDLEQNHQINFQKWATPGHDAASAALDVARTVCRRAERRVVELERRDLHADVIRYLNRLSDLCWLYARWIETAAEK